MDNLDSETLQLSYTVDKKDLINGIWEVISKLKPEWLKENVQYKMFSDGITNKLVGVIYNNDHPNMILVRVFGECTEKFIDRQEEIANMKVLHTLGFGPTLYACFSNGLAYEYLPGETLTVDTCLDPNIYHLVAEKMAQFHQQLCNMHSNSHSESKDTKLIQPILWGKLNSFIKLLPEKDIPNSISKDILVNELIWLERILVQTNNKLVFCHNDLLLANILHNKEKCSIEFIDFEYAGPNYQAYDIANHFCEFAGVDSYDPSRYPSEAFRRKWISIYLSSFDESKVVDDIKVQLLLDHVELFTLASNFFWGVWAILQATYSSIDFDFVGYSNLRLAEYFKKKKSVCG